MTEERILTQNDKSKVTWTGISISLDEQLCYITDILPIRDFCYLQHLKYVGPICRLDNSELQKQVIFDLRTPRKSWTGIEAAGYGCSAGQENDDEENTVPADCGKI